MENRFEHNQPEEQGWGAYVTPPRYSAQESPPQTPLKGGLCTRVMELLPALLENDGDIRPEMAAAVYGHLSSCPACAHEFDEMQRTVRMLESLGQAEMPMDFSALIMEKIQTEGPLLMDCAAQVPTGAVSSRASEEAATAVVRSRGSASTRTTTTSTIGNSRLQSTTEIAMWERFTLAGILSAMLAVFLSTEWGRNMIGANLQAASAWLEQVKMALERVPVLGTFVAYIAAALSQVIGLVQETYNTLGYKAAIGVALDASLCGAAYYFLMARHRRSQNSGY